MTSVPDPSPAGSPGEFPFLDAMGGPGDLQGLDTGQLEEVAKEVRRRIVGTVLMNGGHLASSLGVVELTLALYQAFDPERDRIVWDVGHQGYCHKLLTARHGVFPTLRMKGGLSGYPRRSESRYDAFGAGHSSTSISAGLGMAVARDLLSRDYRVVSVIGDGALTGGMAFEALNHAGHLGTDLLVVLNDNEMSIAKNVGGMSASFSRMIASRGYKRAKEDVTGVIKRILGPQLSQVAHRLEQALKNVITAGGLFQELGFNYIGPVDGHDLPALVEFFRNLRSMHGPVLFHCVTQKGRGFTDAERDPEKYHGVKPWRPKKVDNEGEARPPEKAAGALPIKTFSEAFGEAMVELGARDPRIVAITAAMPAGTGLDPFQDKFPDRFFDVAICEQHAVTFAAGLAAQGLRPVCAIYSTFFQRAYDQFIHDVCLQKLPVVFALDRAGLVGEDEPTHTGMFDLSFLRVIPNATIFAPRDDCDLKVMLEWALASSGPAVIRYPKDLAPTLGECVRNTPTSGECLRKGSDAMFLAVGPLVGTCLMAARALERDGYSVGVADARCIKPLDAVLLEELASVPIVTVEENTLFGGFGSAVLEHYEQCGRLADVRIRRIGLPDAFGEHASRDEQIRDRKLDVESIADVARDWFARIGAHAVKGV